MANVLTGLIPTIYDGLNVVSREMVGFIPAVTRSTTAERAALNQAVTVPVAAIGAVEDITPGATPADTGDSTQGTATITITKSRAAPIRWSGEEEMSVGNENFQTLMRDQFAEAFRALVNEIEVDLGATIKNGSSRAYGTAGTAPFGTAANLTDTANLRKILRDNGAPQSDLQLVLGSAAWVNLNGKQSNLFKVNEAGDSVTLNEGFRTRLHGFTLRDSAGVQLHTKGTGASYVSNAGTTEPLGETSIAVDTGTGTILAGDIITQADDAVNKYVVNSALSGGAFTIGKPGLVDVDIDDGDAVTVGDSYTANVGFSRSAVILATRAPAMPTGGDSAEDSTIVVDPVSGLQFEVSVYREYKRVKFEVAIAWGQSVIKSEHVATLLG